MIYWHAKLYKGNSQQIPSSFSELTYIEDVIVNLLEASDFNEETATGLKTYDLLQSKVGNQADSLYVPPYYTRDGVGTDSLEALMSQHPSIADNYNVFWPSYVQNTQQYLFLYIPSLERIITNTGGFYGTVNGDTITTLGYFGPFSSVYVVIGRPGVITSYTIHLTLIAKYTEQSDLINGKNFCRMMLRYTGGLSDFIKDTVQTGLSDADLIRFFGDNGPDGIGPISPNNPYEPGGDSGEGGGGGSFDDDSDPIPDSTLPTISSSNTGFTRIYNPTLSQVQALAQYLWTDESIIQTVWNHIKQFFEDPMQAIIGFNLVPCVVPNGGTTTFKIMYLDTGVPMTAAANQFVDVDCGTLSLKKYYGSALDYSPYTKISCFLPYIGTVHINTDEVMDTTLQVKYRIDICSGSCVAKILVNGNVLYQYSGHCAIAIPISAADFSGYVQAAISVAQLAVGGLSAGASAALATLSNDPSQQTNQVVTTTQVTDTARNPSTGRQITTGTRTITETRESPANQSSTMASFAGISPSNIANTVGQIMGAKPSIEHTGSFSGNTGYLGVRRPFLIIERPNMCMPAQYQQFNGFPSMITETLSNLKGFTKVQQVQLTGMSATNPEQAEILEFLKSGVII